VVLNSAARSEMTTQLQDIRDVMNRAVCSANRKLLPQLSPLLSSFSTSLSRLLWQKLSDIQLFPGFQTTCMIFLKIIKERYVFSAREQATVRSVSFRLVPLLMFYLVSTDRLGGIRKRMSHCYCLLL